MSKQNTTLFLYSEHRFTNLVDSDDDFRVPTAYVASTFKISGLTPSHSLKFQYGDIADNDFAVVRGLTQISFENTPWISQVQATSSQVKAVFRRDDLTGFLPAGQVQANAIAGSTYNRCFTPGLLSKVYQRQSLRQQAENLLPNATTVLGGTGDQGAGYFHLVNDGNW